MLSWEGGGFSTKRGEEAAKETIIKGWQSLLLEGMRRVDEANPDKKSSAAERQAIMLKKMSDILDKIIAIKEVVFATLFDPEGFPVASKMSDKYDISEITPIISNLIRQSEQVGQDMKLSAVKHISVEFENGLLSMENVPGKKEFLVFLSENANAHRVIKLKAKKYLRELSKLLN